MIAKITYGANFYGVLAYAESKEESLSVGEDGIEKEPGFERLSVNNFQDGRHFFSNKRELSNSLTDWSAASRRVEKHVFHASIALPPGEALSNFRINQLAVAYMEKMGYANNPFVVYKHNDTQHSHVHIISSRVGDNGKVINPSFEFRKNLPVCRELEKEFNLQVVSSIKAKAPAKHAASDSEYAREKPFKTNVLQNIEFAVNVRKIPNLTDLGDYLRKRNIELVYSQPDGRRLSKSGVVFYRLSKEGKRESRLKGWALGKEFGKKLENRLERNAGIMTEENTSTGIMAAAPSTTASTVPNPKLSFQQQVRISKAIYATYHELTAKVIFTEEDIQSIASKNGILINVKKNKAGFNGFSISANGFEYKPSDFSHNSIKLSSAFIKEYLVSPPGTDPLLHRYNVLLSRFQKSTPYSELPDFLNYLNRNGLHIRIAESGYQLFVLNNPALAIALAPTSIPAGNENTRRIIYDHVPLSSLDFGQLALYNALLVSNKDTLARISRHSIDFSYSEKEKVMLPGLSLFQSVVDMQNRLKISVAREIISNTSLTIGDIVGRLNNRGLHLDLKFAGDKIIGIVITDRISGIELNQFSLTMPFNARWLQDKIGHDDVQTILKNQVTDAGKATIFNQFERTGIISPAHYELLLNDSHYHSEVTTLASRYHSTSDSKEDGKEVTPAANKTVSSADLPARGDQDILYGRVINQTYFNDLWDSPTKGR